MSLIKSLVFVVLAQYFQYSVAFEVRKSESLATSALSLDNTIIYF